MILSTIHRNLSFHAAVKYNLKYVNGGLSISLSSNYTQNLIIKSNSVLSLSILILSRLILFSLMIVNILKLCTFIKMKNGSWNIHALNCMLLSSRN